MININSLTLTNFKSFIGTHSFDFSKLKPGLYLLTGKNLVEKRLGANAVGKSSFIGSLCWALFGKDEKRFKAGTIANWDISKKCDVSVIMNKDKHIQRSWKPNFLKEDGNIVDTVEPLINTTYDGFLHSIFIGQDSVQFFDLDPAKKLEVFSSILNLTFWDDLSKKTKKSLELIEVVIKETEEKLTRVIARIEATQWTDWDRSIKSWEGTRQKNLTKLEDNINNYIDKLEKLETTKDEIECDFNEDDVDKVNKEAQLLSSVLSDFVEDSLTFVKQARAPQEVERLQKDIKEIEDNDYESNCDFCFQEIDTDVVDLKIKSLNEQLEQKNIELRDHNTKSLYYKKTIEGAREARDAKVIEQNNVISSVQKKKTLIGSLKMRINDLSNTIDNLTEQYDDLEKEENSFIKDKVISEKKVINFKLDKERIEQTLLNLNRDYEMTEFWVKGFKDVRFMVVESALAELDILVNNYLGQLGLEDWTIKFMVDKETKSKTIRKGFDMFVQSPHNKEMTPFRAWSGGEQSRLRLSGTLGLSDFIINRGSDFNIRFFDEPTAWLSQEGIDDLLNLLKRKADDDQKIIFIIDHRPFGSFDFDGVFTINKTERGSHFG